MGEVDGEYIKISSGLRKRLLEELLKVIEGFVVEGIVIEGFFEERLYELRFK